VYNMCVFRVKYFLQGFTMSFFLRQRWKDPRLKYTFESSSPYLFLDSDSIQKVWRPDLYILNEKSAKNHEITVPNMAMYIYRDGSIFFSHRVTGEFSCFLNLRKYPLDRQKCHIMFESYGHPARKLVFRWHKSAVEISKDVELPQFELDSGNNFSTFICDHIYHDDNYTCIGADFHLTRNQGYYFVQIYIPTSLIVMLSWSNFWLNVDAIPARISLGLLTVLTMATSSASAGANLPRVSYIKAMDVWIFVCMFFVFAAFLEYAWVNVSLRVEQRRKSPSGTVVKPVCNGVKSKYKIMSKNRERARNIDRVARVLFPVCFLIFNLCYWTFYTLWEPVKHRTVHS
ncbi:hypothetical protein FSP39_024773, partial [Pinctada imbricata]